MYSFRNDYCEGAHTQILEALLQSNMEQEEGYGLDSHSLEAVKLIRGLVEDEACGVHLISGGTQTNLIAISGLLRPHEACIAPISGHIATHETGAIEATGHKIITVNTEDGKLTPEKIGPVLEEHHFEHMVKPRLVYISNPTEVGTVYTKEELKALYEFCGEMNLLLYCDGARLGAALTCKSTELTLKDIYDFTDVFFIGGTKVGALMGEALVIKNGDLKEEFRYLIKQRGALLAKGRILGIQFEELFRDGLYFDLARHSNEMAQLLVTKLRGLGCDFMIDSPTNQIFPILENQHIEELSKTFLFYTWAKMDDQRSAIRLITSWATKEEQIHKFIKTYKKVISLN